MPSLRNCVVFQGSDLTPVRCQNFSWAGDTITAIDGGPVVEALEDAALVVIPGLYNGHTHVGDGALPDGASGLTLEQGFFRPHGYKYRELAKLDHATHLAHLKTVLRDMARSGTVGHLDFREQGTAGAELLREASHDVGMDSIILSQFDTSPQSESELESGNPPLPETALAELDAMLQVADGFSESTMNDLTPAAWAQIREQTTRFQKLRAIHCLENPGYRELSARRHGRGDLARAFAEFDPDIIVHLTCADPEEILLMARSGKAAVINPRANATLGLNLPPVLPLLDAGARLLLGTDNVMLNPPNLWAELDFTFRLARSQSGENRPDSPDSLDLLRMVTTNIRPTLGGDHHGCLDVGLPASFVVLDFTQGHLRHTRNLATSVVSRVSPREVLATVHRGRELWRSAELSF